MGKKEKKKEKNKREGRESRSCVAPLPLPVGLNSTVDDEDFPTLSSCLPLVPRVGILGQSWRSIPPGGRYGQRTPLTETMLELEV
jgi:hypothetical protein